MRMPDLLHLPGFEREGAHYPTKALSRRKARRRGSMVKVYSGQFIFQIMALSAAAKLTQNK
jgi:hypothetical protein